MTAGGATGTARLGHRSSRCGLRFYGQIGSSNSRSRIGILVVVLAGLLIKTAWSGHRLVAPPCLHRCGLRHGDLRDLKPCRRRYPIGSRLH